jgi:hypothetical protein
MGALILPDGIDEVVDQIKLNVRNIRSGFAGYSETAGKRWQLR